MLLNTAVVQRVNARPDQVPPPELDLGLQMIERQTYATADTSTCCLLSTQHAPAHSTRRTSLAICVAICGYMTAYHRCM